jgi:hypothetical protein
VKNRTGAPFPTLEIRWLPCKFHAENRVCGWELGGPENARGRFSLTETSQGARI